MSKLIILILLLPLLSIGQNDYLDSLANVTYNSPNKDDSIQMHNYVLLVRGHLKNKSLDSIIDVSLKAIEFAEKDNNPEYLTTAFNLKGVGYNVKKQYKDAIKAFSIAFNFSKTIKYPTRIKCVVSRNMSGAYEILGNLDSSFFYANETYKEAIAAENIDYQTIALSLIASYHIKKGSFPLALENLNQSLSLAIEIKDTAKIINANLNIGKILFDFKKFDQMIDLYNKLLVDYDTSYLSNAMGLINLNIGSAYSEKGMQEKSLEYTYKVLSSDNDIWKGIANGNIGETYLKLLKDGIPAEKIPLLEEIDLENNEYQNEAFILNTISNHFDKSYEYFDKISANNYKLYPHRNMGDFYDYTKDHNKAVESFDKAWEIAESNSLLNDQKDISEKLYQQYKKLNNPVKSLVWYEKFIEVSDSLNSSETQQEIGKQLASFEYTNIRLKDSLEQVKKDEVQQIKIAQQEKNIENEQLKKYYLIGGMAITFLLLIILFRRFNITKKQKQLIELQKSEMEQKQIELSKTHLEIKDSINYSKRIQKSIFPSKSEFDAIFKNNFILFKPKDVVSGDFYWCHQVGNKKIIVLADCTGHGVPGAFMTIVGINIFKEIIQEGILDSAKMLIEVNAKLKKRLGENGQKVKDGMDLGICIIDDSTIEYSGAHFPLYHIRDREFIEYKGSSIFLGNEDEITNIKTHYIPYKQGDLIYLSTDGYPDQKGGPKGKKYFYRPFRNLILKNSSLPLEEQKEILKKEFENWLLTGKRTQMDDVTMVGIKL